MRKLGLLLLQFVFISTAYGQSIEYSVHLNSGLFSFGGESATERSLIVISDIASIDSYTNNPYGTNKSLSYGMSAQFRRITDHKLILGLQTGYELLRSHVKIDDVAGEFLGPPPSVSGQTTFKNGFIVLYPHIGRRFIINNLDIDLSIGPELGFNVLSREKGEARSNNNTIIKTDRKRRDPGTDIRLRSSLTFYYNKVGISTGYSYGLKNYSGDLVGGNRERFSRFIRFGLTYRIK